MMDNTSSSLKYSKDIKAIADKVVKQEENFQYFQSTLNNLDTSLKANIQSFQAQFDLFKNEINEVSNGLPI
jgi:hypothetical protein